jgi:hypothetical protein
MITNTWRRVRACPVRFKSEQWNSELSKLLGGIAVMRFNWGACRETALKKSFTSPT